MDESTLLRSEIAEMVLAIPIGDGVGADSNPSGYITACAVAQAASITNPDATRGMSSVTRRESPRERDASIGSGPHNGILPSSRFGVVESDELSSPPLRIIVAKPGLDGHDRGAKVVARALRDAGMEVIYTGLHQTPEQIVATALAEDADAIGLSVLSGAHMTLFAKVVELLKAANADDIVVFGGGIIPDADREALAEMGVARVFTPGATMSEIVAWVRANVGAARRI